VTRQQPIRLDVATRRRTEWVEITDQVSAEVRQAGVQHGAALVYVPHTTAGITINENADPSVAADMVNFLEELVPRHKAAFTHAEGNSDAHIKASLMGSSVRVIVREGRLALGQWQGIFLCEFDGPRRRQVWIAFEKGE
jgi:secondary thiamine-phosphate synthase enzyme